MKDFVIGFVLGYWLKDKIDPKKIESEEKTQTPNGQMKTTAVAIYPQACGLQEFRWESDC